MVGEGDESGVDSEARERGEAEMSGGEVDFVGGVGHDAGTAFAGIWGKGGLRKWW